MLLVAPVVVAEPVFEPLQLTDADKAVIEKVTLGNVPCELGANVVLMASPTQPGRFVVEHNKRRFYMVVTQTTTGAIRLEDPAQGAVWLQLANKSMLMDQKNGRRLADACMNPAQMLVAEAGTGIGKTLGYLLNDCSCDHPEVRAACTHGTQTLTDQGALSGTAKT